MTTFPPRLIPTRGISLVQRTPEALAEKLSSFLHNGTQVSRTNSTTKTIHPMFIEIGNKIVNSSYIYRVDKIKKDENIIFLQIRNSVESHLVNDEAYEIVRKMLLKKEKDNLSDQVKSLTSVVRDLWKLLSARLR
jgi:hypothetical protein